MKSFSEYIKEAYSFRLGGSQKKGFKEECQYFPKDRDELHKYMKDIFDKDGDDGNYNLIDVSAITDFSGFFQHSGRFKTCNLSDWDMSSVTNMENMFCYSDFNGDISGWDVGNVKNMKQMFAYSDFNSDISGWNVSKVTNMNKMFLHSKFSQDLSAWKPLKLKKADKTFGNTPISASKKYPQWYIDLKDEAWIKRNIGRH